MKNFLLASSLLATFTGCMRNKDDGADSPAAAADSEEGVSDESNLMIATVDGVSGTAADDIAASVAANVTARWPSGCAVATASGANVTITYTDCTGPYGLVHVTGELDVAFSVTANSIAFQASASGLEVNSATVDFTSDGTYSVSGTTQTFTVATSGTGTGPLGNDLDHDGNYTVTWDSSDSCGSLDGSWSTELSTPVASATRSNAVNLSRCGLACPTGTLEHTYLGGQSLSITFDGTATAHWSTSGGLSGNVLLACLP